jgi:YcaO-like protein with predicted kinase domain
MFPIQEIVRKHFHGGTYRLVSPEETFERYQRFMPVMGITRVANITGLDVIGIPVMMVCRPNSRSVAVSQGKGLTLAAAKASGLMESIENYHAEHILLPLKLASFEELRYSHTLVDMDRLPRVQGSLYHPNLRILWIEGYDILNNEPTWVPYELAHTDYTLPPPTGSGCFPPTSNGLASGNHLLEAITHGVNEIIERDATALWNIRTDEERQATRLDLTTVDDPGCREVIDKFHAAGVEAAVWETTSDIGLPAFICAVIEREDNPLRRLYATTGMGCHTTRQTALLRALTEAAQSRLTVIAGSRDDILYDQYEHFSSPDVLARFRDTIFGHNATRHFHDVPSYENDTFNADLDLQMERLQAVGIEEIIVINLTRREFNIPVVRVIIPGLEGIPDFEEYAPGERVLSRIRERHA